MKSYNELRQQYRLEIEQSTCRCILSGLYILDKKFLSLEHYLPCCRGEWGETHDIRNVFPAYKILNNLKGPRLPCEWEKDKIKILQKSLRKGKLRQIDRDIVEETIVYAPYYDLNPCSLCIWKNKCKEK